MRPDQMPRQPDSDCQECGMRCHPNEYHPYSACLMFKACRNGKTVRENLGCIREDAELEVATERAAKEALQQETKRLVAAVTPILRKFSPAHGDDMLMAFVEGQKFDAAWASITELRGLLDGSEVGK